MTYLFYLMVKSLIITKSPPLGSDSDITEKITSFIATFIKVILVEPNLVQIVTTHELFPYKLFLNI